MRKLLFLLMLLFIAAPASFAQAGGFASPTGSSSSTANSANLLAGGTIDPRNFGAKADGNALFDASFTNTSQIVTSASAKFLTGIHPAKVGQIVFGTCCGHLGGMSHFNSVIQVPRGTITSVDTDTQIHVSIAATANQSNGNLMYWTDDTAAWNSAIAAAWGNAGLCLTLIVPPGMSGYSLSNVTGFATSITCRNEMTNPSTTGAAMRGSDRTVSILLLDPNSTYAPGAGCINNACMFGPLGMNLRDFTIWGGEFSPSGSTHSGFLMDAEIDDRYDNILIVGLFAGDSTFTGIRFSGAGAFCTYCLVDGVGNRGAEVVAGSWALVNNFYGDMNNQALIIDATTSVISTNSGYGPVQASGFLAINNSGTFWSTQDRTLCYNTTNATIGLTTQSGGKSYISQGQYCAAAPANTGYKAFNVSGAGSVLVLRDTTVRGGSAGNSIIKAADTSVVYLDDVNVLSGPISGIAPTCSTTNASACTVVGTNESLTIKVTGNGANASGVVTLTFAGTVTPPAGINAQAFCNANLSNASAGQWVAGATIIPTAYSATAPTFTWTNNATVLTNATVYEMIVTCPALKL